MTTPSTSINTKKWPASKIKGVFFIVAIALPILLLVGAIVPQYYTSFVGTPAEYKALLDKYRPPLISDEQWNKGCNLQLAHENLGSLICGFIVAVCGIYFKWYGNLWNRICKKFPHYSKTSRSFIFLAIMSLLFATLNFQFFPISVVLFIIVIMVTAVFCQFLPVTLFYTLSRKRTSPLFAALITVAIFLILNEGYHNYNLFSVKRYNKRLEETANNKELLQLADRLGFPRESIRFCNGKSGGTLAIKTLFGEVIRLHQHSMSTPRHGAAAFAREYQRTQQSRVVKLSSFLLPGIFKYLSAAFVASNPIFFEMFGFVGEPLIAAPFISEALLFPINLALHSLQQFIARMYEYDADNSAIKLGYGTELIDILTDSYAYHYNNPMFEALYADKPCLVNRLKNVLSQQ